MASAEGYQAVVGDATILAGPSQGGDVHDVDCGPITDGQRLIRNGAGRRGRMLRRSLRVVTDPASYPGNSWSRHKTNAAGKICSGVGAEIIGQGKTGAVSGILSAGARFCCRRQEGSACAWEGLTWAPEFGGGRCRGRVILSRGMLLLGGAFCTKGHGFGALAWLYG
jgi:hypothetical protein